MLTIAGRLGHISCVGRTKEIGHVVVHVVDSDVEDTGVRVNAVGNAGKPSDVAKINGTCMYESKLSNSARISSKFNYNLFGQAF